jgi:phage tail sheath protein FI
MAAAIKTPGVYIKEINAFPNSVVEVATAVPAFIGYTEKIPPGPNVPPISAALPKPSSRLRTPIVRWNSTPKPASCSIRA